MKPRTLGAFEAKTHLSELIEQVRRGRSFVITLRGRPVAELRPLAEPAGRARYGCDRGQVILGSDFDAPLDEFEEYER
jgi:prevent-host-death family protein